MAELLNKGLPRRQVLGGLAGVAAAPFINFAAMPVMAQSSGGMLRYILASEPASLSLGRLSGANISVMTKVREGLLSYGLDLAPQGQLATAWEVSEDGKTYVFTLREGVRWHDGEPFTADDVVFSFNFQMERKNPIVQSLESAEARDPLTAVLTFSQPAPYLLSLLSTHNVPIIPAHAYEGMDTQAVGASENMIGTGPFTFVEWERGSHVMLQRNPDYWDEGKPYLDGIVIPFIPDAQSRALALEADEVDVGSETPVPRSDVERMRALSNIDVEGRGYERAPNVVHIGFNLRDDRFSDVRVRQAIAHAIDKAEVLRTVWFGQGEVTENLIPPVQRDFYEPDVRTYPHDLEAANALMDEAGFPRQDGGMRFSIRLDYFPQQDMQSFADFVKSALADIGIDVQIRNQEQAGFIRSIWTEYDFDAYIMSFNLDADPAYAMPRPYATDKIVKGVFLYNAGNFSDPEVDALINAGAVEPDLEARKKIYSDLQKKLAEILPVIPILVRAHYTIANSKLQDHTVSSNGVPKSGLAEAWLEG